MGCGVGTWLSVLKEKGVKDIKGVDGNWVDPNLFEIPEDSFKQIDLNSGLDLSGTYDLAICLEVAEHLPHERAQDFIRSLTGLSHFVRFSAAIPFQGGSNHVNEQWPDYWAAIFDSRGYEVVDCIRSSIWTDEKIPTWYRQNTFLYVRRERLDDVSVENGGLPFPMLSVVNPDSFVNKVSTVKVSWRTFRKALKRWFFAKLWRRVTEQQVQSIDT